MEGEGVYGAAENRAGEITGGQEAGGESGREKVSIAKKRGMEKKTPARLLERAQI